MKVIDPGHFFELDVYDGRKDQTSTLTFMKRREPPEKYPGNRSSYPGTNLQEVLRAAIARVRYLDAQFQCCENTSVLDHLQKSIFELELRAARRHGRGPESLGLRLIESNSERRIFDLSKIEDLPTCKTCGHLHPGLPCH